MLHIAYYQLFLWFLFISSVHGQMMEEWGNARCKAYYEAEVPASYQRPVEGAGVRDVQRWIKDK